MTLLSILIALLLERITPQFVQFRKFQWLRDYTQWMSDVLHIEKLNYWLALGILISPLLIVAWILTSMFENALFGLFELAFSVVVIFLCLGPRDLDKQIDHYLDAIEVGDEQQRFATASGLTNNTPATELPAQVVQVCKSLFVEANMRIYAVLFWFVLFGPVAAVMYRLLEQLLRNTTLLEGSLSALRKCAQQLLGWIDWIPTHLALFAYMVSGSFDDGLQAFRRGSIAAVNTYEQNKEILESVGFHSLTVSEAFDQAQATDMLKKARGLILRSLVVWLLLLVLISLID